MKCEAQKGRERDSYHGVSALGCSKGESFVRMNELTRYLNIHTGSPERSPSLLLFSLQIDEQVRTINHSQLILISK